eukprot:CAMPEP_0178421174 /NCGR_PEP_ID=MMETSP0689_2-20121128/26512_1 /TAXON_ID=160604 /ORGANISM="Amphidinium massartii, Strain CS-259" /LENGTH=325 /DNA_ID=CAMNT_0020042679 /DNA_START=1 /DNA_END=974 /DNA_ORIENTATION=-
MFRGACSHADDDLEDLEEDEESSDGEVSRGTGSHTPSPTENGGTHGRSGCPVKLVPRAERAQASATSSGEETERKKAILVNHGSFNPAHRGHIFMMELAKKRAEEAGYEVLAGRMGIANKEWIWRKGERALKDHLRVQFIDMLAREAGCGEWLQGDIRGEKHKSYWDLGRTIAQEEAQFRDATIFGVVGGDWCQGRFPWGGPCICVQRKGTKNPQEDVDKLELVVIDDDERAFSSTRVREALQAGNKDELRKIVGGAVATHLENLGVEQWEEGTAPVKRKNGKKKRKQPNDDQEGDSTTIETGKWEEWDSYPDPQKSGTWKQYGR